MKHTIFLVIIFSFFNCNKETEETNEEPSLDNTSEIYFPETSTVVWEIANLTDLNWNEDQLQPLLDFLAKNNTKGFIILYNGRIIVENYFNDHTALTPWYWASAGKTLTTTLSGIAQVQGHININNKVSDYIGTGWTNTSLEKENLITCKNLLTMTSGLDDSLGDDISSTNLKYIADANTRWAYHNVYKKMQDVISTAANASWTDYFDAELKNKIGMSGEWRTFSHFNLFWSNTRSMARYGLLIFADGKWNNSQIIPTDFLKEATTVSQNINASYGYLWWLNGKESYRLPNSQQEFTGSLIPNAPDDMIVALGLNDQKIYISPSKKLVVVRMGEAADEENFALSNFDNELWQKINALID